MRDGLNKSLLILAPGRTGWHAAEHALRADSVVRPGMLPPQSSLRWEYGKAITPKGW